MFAPHILSSIVGLGVVASYSVSKGNNKSFLKTVGWIGAMFAVAMAENPLVSVVGIVVAIMASHSLMNEKLTEKSTKFLKKP